jgi:hypothetical protein
MMALLNRGWKFLLLSQRLNAARIFKTRTLHQENDGKGFSSSKGYFQKSPCDCLATRVFLIMKN